MKRSIYIQFALVALALLVLFYVALFKEEEYTEKSTEINIRLDGSEQVYEEEDGEGLLSAKEAEEAGLEQAPRDEIIVNQQPTPRIPTSPGPGNQSAEQGENQGKPVRNRPEFSPAGRPEESFNGQKNRRPGGPPPSGSARETSYNSGNQAETLYK